MNDLGPVMSAHTIEVGLRELNNELSFDADVRRPSDYARIMRDGPAAMNISGVYYKGDFVCAMGRGDIHERDVWEMQEGVEPISMADVDRYDEAKVIYIEILPTDPFYHQALLKAENKDDNYSIDGDGRLFRYEAFRYGMQPKRILAPGWRHTLTRVASRGIPGVTHGAVAAKFGVRL